jgi:putative flippase GtrA
MASGRPADSTAKQAGKFGLIGVLNTVIDYTIFISLTKIFSIPLDRVWVAKFFSGSVAMANSFYFNRRWVFHHVDHTGKRAFRFVVTTLVAVYIIQILVVQFFSTHTFVGTFFYDIANSLGIITLAPQIFTRSFVIKTVAFAIGVGTTMVWNFTLYKLWAFRE